MANLTFTDDGLEWLVKRLFDPASAEDPLMGVAIGSSSTAPSTADAALVAETARDTAVFTYVSPGVCLVSCVFAAGIGTGTVAEVGLLTNDTAGGILIGRAVVSSFTKGAGDSYTAEFPLDLTDLNA